MLPLSPDAQRFRDLRNGAVVGVLLLVVGVGAGYYLCRMAHAAEQVLEAATTYHLLSCLVLGPTFAPGLC